MMLLWRQCRGICSPTRLCDRPAVHSLPRQQQRPCKPCSGTQRSSDASTAAAAARRRARQRRRDHAERREAAQQLLTAIQACHRLDDLQQLVRQHAASFNASHACAAITAVMPLVDQYPEGRELAFVKQLFAVAQSRLGQCNGEQLACLAYALHEMDCMPSEAFSQQLIRHAKQQLPSLSVHSTVRMLQGYVLMPLHDKEFCKLLLAHAATQLADTQWGLGSYHLASLLVAASKKPIFYHVERHEYLRQLLAWAPPQLPYFGGCDLANTLWAVLRQGYYDGPLVEGMLQELVTPTKLAHCRPRELLNVVCALAYARHYDQRAMHQLLLGLKADLPSLTEPDLCQVLRALAILGHQDQEFVNAAVSRLAAAPPRELGLRACLDALWALPMLQHDAAPAVRPLLTAAASLLSTPECETWRRASVSDTSTYSWEYSRELLKVYQYLAVMRAGGHLSPELEAALLTSRAYQELWRDCQVAYYRIAGSSARSPLCVVPKVLGVLRGLPGCGGAELRLLAADGVATIALQLPCNTKVGESR